jgi:hypothetical protein
MVESLGAKLRRRHVLPSSELGFTPFNLHLKRQWHIFLSADACCPTVV